MSLWLLLIIKNWTLSSANSSLLWKKRTTKHDTFKFFSILNAMQIFAFPIRIHSSSFLFHLPSFVNTTTRCLNFSIYCSELPLICSIHCCGFLEKHTTLVFLAIISLDHTQSNNQSSVATSPLALQWMCGSPQTEWARRTTPHICGANKQ